MSFLRTVESNIAQVGKPEPGSREAQLQALRDRHVRSDADTRQQSSSSSLQPPAQSRDGSAPSRYFPPGTGLTGQVLVPSSSPMSAPSSGYTPHMSHFTRPAHQVSQRTNIFDDPFVAPPQFKSSVKARPPPRDPADEPPRKRQNVGTNIVEDVSSPVTSPEVLRRITKRKQVVQSDDDDDMKPTGSRIRRRESPTPTGNGVPPLASFLGPGAAIIPPAGIQSKTSSVSAHKAAQAAQKEQQARRKQQSALYAHRNAPALSSNIQFVPYVPKSGGSTTQAQRQPIQPQPVSTPKTQQQKPKRKHGSDSEEDFRDDGMDSDASGGGKAVDDVQEIQCIEEALKFFNNADSDNLVNSILCTPDQAQIIIGMRPFLSVDDVERKMVRRSGVSSKLFENYKDLIKGYIAVDAVLECCEQIGKELDTVVSKWSKADEGAETGTTTPDDGEVGVHLTQAVPPPLAPDDPAMQDYISQPPVLLASDVTLKAYQMIGVNWLNLLHSRGHSCILADEMGLGKTIQVIAFLAHLKVRKSEQKHLIIVPASTLENWIREFNRFAPSMIVRPYYGTIPERAALRQNLLQEADWDVLVTTYNFAQGGDYDRKFFKKVPWATCVFDEGHVLKNFQSQRYGHLMKITAEWRLLLTGTPLQNNLQELLSLMNFILPVMFNDVSESFRAIFKVKAASQVSLLAHSRVSRAKRMMTPFVLRRRKDQVLKELPKKTERIVWCPMTDLQRTIYRDAMKRSKRVLMAEEKEDELEIAESRGQKGRPKKKKGPKTTQQDPSSNVLMDLRKATAHPMLYRRLYDDKIIEQMARLCLKEPEFQESKYELVLEDMGVMTDAELHHFCMRYKSVRKFALDEWRHLEAGKITVLFKLLEAYQQQNRRTLIFSQFTQVLDILKTILEHKNIKYLLLTGSTAVDERQGMVDEFNQDGDIRVFLLSTKAGGMGINLTAASVVIIYDQDFNPHNDLQAADRAYRIGQQQDVDVLKLITKGTIEEDMFKLAQTKLALDEAVAGEYEEGSEKKVEREIKKSLISLLRTQLEQSNSEEAFLAATQIDDLPPPSILYTSNNIASADQPPSEDNAFTASATPMISAGPSAVPSRMRTPLTESAAATPPPPPSSITGDSIPPTQEGPSDTEMVDV